MFLERLLFLYKIWEQVWILHYHVWYVGVMILHYHVWYVGVMILHYHVWYVGVMILHYHVWYVGVMILHYHVWYVGVMILHYHAWYVGVMILHYHVWYVGVNYSIKETYICLLCIFNIGNHTHDYVGSDFWMFYDHLSAHSLLAKLGRWGWESEDTSI